MKDYHINIFYSEEDEAYISIPDLKYCSAAGDTPQEALREIIIAKQAWLEITMLEGSPIPVPRYKTEGGLGMRVFS